MELRQKLVLKKLLVPKLRQSLEILTLPLPDVKMMVEKELVNNPLLQEINGSSQASLLSKNTKKPDYELQLSLATAKPTLQDTLLRQLGMFSNTDEELKIGQEIIGNINENGYLKASLSEIALSLNCSEKSCSEVLKLIQKFEPPGVGARSISECLLIQLELSGTDDPELKKIISHHLQDVAKKNYSKIAKLLEIEPEEVRNLINKLSKLDPKPGRNFSTENIHRIIPDIVIEETDEDEAFDITINNEDIPSLSIDHDYKKMLKDEKISPQAKEFLKTKLTRALELMKAISRRQDTIRKIVVTVAEIQKDGIKNGMQDLLPLTFAQVAKEIDVHESTVCRAVINKYVKTPLGVYPLKDFFPSRITNADGLSASSSYAKKLINELISQEDKLHPLSDLQISQMIIKNNGLKIHRRTVTKYREELKLLSSTFRKER